MTTILAHRLFCNSCRPDYHCPTAYALAGQLDFTIGGGGAPRVSAVIPAGELLGKVARTAALGVTSTAAVANRITGKGEKWDH